MKPVATVINNNQPGWTNIIETEPNVTLEIGTKLYLAESAALPALGSVFEGGFFAGEIIVDDVRYALVVSPKAEGEKMGLEYKKKKLSTADGTDSDDDGPYNSELNNNANHPAAQFCRSLKIAGFNDWYLPSRDELAIICRNLGSNRKKTPELFKNGNTEAFEDDWYWSSTEHASYSDFAWIVYFLNGFQDYYYKSDSNGVRAVRRVQI